MSTLNIALQDASQTLLEAVEKAKVRDASSTRMNATSTTTLPDVVVVVDHAELNSREELTSPSQQQKQQHRSRSSCNGKDSDEEEDPIMAAFLEAQNRSAPSLNFDGWARLIVLSSSSNGTVLNHGNVQ